MLFGPFSSVCESDTQMRGSEPDDCSVFGQSCLGLTIGFILLRHSVVCTCESLSFLYLELYELGDDACELSMCLDPHPNLG